MSAAQSSSFSFGLSKSAFQLSQCSVSEMLSGVLSSSLSTGWWLIHRILRTFHIRVWPPGRSFADKACGKEDLSDKFKCSHTIMWKEWPGCFDDIFRVRNLSYCGNLLGWVGDSIWVARRFWLPGHISKKSWTLAILCHYLSSMSVSISKSLSVFVVSNSGSVAGKLRLLAQVNCLTPTFWRRVSHVVFECLQPITSRPEKKLASTQTPCGMKENMSCATLEKSAYFQGISSCWH